MENPFGDEIIPSGETRKYLMLVSASSDNAKAIQKVLANLKSTVDKNAAPLWIDSKGIGIFISTDLVAQEIRSAAFEGVPGDFNDIKDAVVLEIGADWYARDNTATKNWLTPHVGAPLPPPADSRLRRRKPTRK
ncbi:hypothetical protein KVP09_09050 [Alcaligenaceae bacterium CGII-47]|nr:hypothetical protein [Alcaligenaceae bacterium CGII-47]